MSTRRPIQNTHFYVLDPRSQLPCPIGVPGELYISGAGLALGYIGQPELTAERFLPNPFKQPDDSKWYSRMYKTGEKGCYRICGVCCAITSAGAQTSHMSSPARHNLSAPCSSGDVVAWMPDGNQRYIGRIDQQIKLRGFRIELGGDPAKLPAFPTRCTMFDFCRGCRTEGCRHDACTPMLQRSRQ